MCLNFRPVPARTKGFTLVELLIVIIIIGLLAGMITAGVAVAMRRAKRAQISLEMGQLALALERYKEQHGEYPPDFGVPLNTPVAGTDYAQAVVIRHLRKAFPRFVVPSNLFNRPLTPAGGTLQQLDAAEALVFWLGGLPDAQGVPAGFAKNPANPLIPPTSSPPVPRTLPLFEFDETRLADADGDGWPEYYPPGFLPGREPPYAYFAALPIWYNHPDPTRRYLAQALYPPATVQPHPWGAAKPYARGIPSNYRWLKPKSIQIICAGLDRHFGANALKFFPAGGNYAEEDWDNLTTFYEGTLREASEDATVNP